MPLAIKRVTPKKYMVKSTRTGTVFATGSTLTNAKKQRRKLGMLKRKAKK